MAGKFHSTAFRVTPRSASVRTTIPAAVAALLGVEHLSSLLWTVEPGSGRVMVSVDGAVGKPEGLAPPLSGKKASKRD